MSVLLSDGQIAEKPDVDSSLPLFRLAFRPFFLLGALFSIVSLGLWASSISGSVQLEVYGGPLWWHIHEMLFGFVSAIVVGFLLTAVQTWTGVPGIKGGSLLGLVLLWLFARIAFFLVPWLPGWMIALADLAFLPVAAAVLARSVIKVRQWRNFVFPPILLAMALANAAMHWVASSGDMGLQAQAGNTMVMLVTLLMSIMAGRVVPMFTANGTGTQRVVAISWLEKATITFTLLAVIASLDLLPIPATFVAATFFLAAALHILRVLRWRIWVTLKTPLVWSLHLSYWCIPVGLLLYGLSTISTLVSHTQAIHSLTVGAMGMMILAMISRVSLGHTGRPIAVGAVMTSAFLLLFGAFWLRVFGVFWPGNYVAVIVAAAFFWGLAYGCFVLVYLPILTRARLDGRPG